MMASNILVILAGGSGVRYKADKPKQYTTINGKELLEYSIDEMKLSGKTDKILVDHIMMYKRSGRLMENNLLAFWIMNFHIIQGVLKRIGSFFATG